MKPWAKRSPLIACDFDGGLPARGCFFGGGGGSQPSGNTTTTTNTNPWSGQQPYLSDFFQQAQNFYNGGSTGFNPANAPQYYQGQAVAQFTPQQNQAIDTATNLASNDPTTAAANATSNEYLSGSMLDANPENSMLAPYTSGAMLDANPGTSALQPFLNGSLLSAQNPYFQEAANTTLSTVVPGLEATFNQGNSLNNPGVAYAVGQGAASAIAPYEFSNYQQGLSNALSAAGQESSNFNTGEQAQLEALSNLGSNFNTASGQQVQTLALAPQTQGLGYNDVSQLFNAGSEDQALNQANIQAAINQWNYQQQLPLEMLNQYGNAIQGGYGSTTTLNQPYFTNSLSNALSGGIGGAVLGGMASNGLGIDSGYGALGGAGLGIALGM